MDSLVALLTPSTDTLVLAGMGAALYILGRLFFKE